MSHILEVLPLPILSYPPDEPDIGRQIPIRDTSYMRTQDTEDGPLINPRDSNGDLTSYLIIVDRFIPEKDGRRVCAMCGYVQPS